MSFGEKVHLSGLEAVLEAATTDAQHAAASQELVAFQLLLIKHYGPDIWDVN